MRREVRSEPHFIRLLFWVSLRNDSRINLRPMDVLGDPIPRAVAYQEDTAIEWDPVRPPQLTKAQKLDVLLNLPAYIAALPLALLWEHQSDLSPFYAATAFVPFVWFRVGRWIDRVVGHLASPTKPQSRFERVGRTIVAVLAGIWFVSGLFTVTPMNHHRHEDSSWIGATGMLWSGLAFTMAVVRGTRPAPPPEN